MPASVLAGVGGRVRRARRLSRQRHDVVGVVVLEPLQPSPGHAGLDDATGRVVGVGRVAPMVVQDLQEIAGRIVAILAANDGLDPGGSIGRVVTPDELLGAPALAVPGLADCDAAFDEALGLTPQRVIDELNRSRGAEVDAGQLAVGRPREGGLVPERAGSPHAIARRAPGVLNLVRPLALPDAAPGRVVAALDRTLPVVRANQQPLRVVGIGDSGSILPGDFGNRAIEVAPTRGPLAGRVDDRDELACLALVRGRPLREVDGAHQPVVGVVVEAVMLVPLVDHVLQLSRDGAPAEPDACAVRPNHLGEHAGQRVLPASDGAGAVDVLERLIVGVPRERADRTIGELNPADSAERIDQHAGALPQRVDHAGELPFGPVLEGPAMPDPVVGADQIARGIPRERTPMSGGVLDPHEVALPVVAVPQPLPQRVDDGERAIGFVEGAAPGRP